MYLRVRLQVRIYMQFYLCLRLILHEQVQVSAIPVETVRSCAGAIVNSAFRGERYLTEPPWFKVTYFWKVFCPEVLRVLLQGDVYEQARDSRQRSPQQEDIGSHRSQEHPVSFYTTLP